MRQHFTDDQRSVGRQIPDRISGHIPGYDDIGLTGNVLVRVDPRHIDLVWILGREDLPAFPLVGQVNFIWPASSSDGPE
jgi:hypothetical protein